MPYSIYYQQLITLDALDAKFAILLLYFINNSMGCREHKENDSRSFFATFNLHHIFIDIATSPSLVECSALEGTMFLEKRLGTKLMSFQSA